MTRAERITIDPNICHGKPCIRGSRYPVENVLEWLSTGMSVDDILADYEDLEREDIDAVLEWRDQLSLPESHRVELEKRLNEPNPQFVAWKID